MRILILAPDAPFPPVGGGKTRIYYLLRALAARHDLTLVGFHWGTRSDDPPFPIRVVEVPWEMPPLYRKMMGEDTAAAQAAFTRLSSETDEPFLVSYFHSPAMEETLRTVTREPFDLVILENAFMGRFIPALPAHIPKVLDLPDVLSLIARRRAESASGEEERVKADYDRTLGFEKWAASQSALCVAVSDEEASAARGLWGVGRVEVVPNGVDTSFFTPGEGSGAQDDLLFTGSMNYWPNVEAVRYFTREILSLVQRDFPGVKLHIVGSSPVEEVKELASGRVLVHGAVPDMRPYFHRATLVVVPILHGGGTRLKILEAAACGKAIVSTSLGAEGLEFRPGHDLILADSAEEFADAVSRLLRDEEQRRWLGRAAREASLRYDWERIGSYFCHLIDNLAHNGLLGSDE